MFIFTQSKASGRNFSCIKGSKMFSLEFATDTDSRHFLDSAKIVNIGALRPCFY